MQYIMVHYFFFCILLGLQMKSSGSSDTVHHGPFTLFPSFIPRNILIQAKDTQKDFNVLMHRVAHDYDFLYESLKKYV